MSLEIVLLAPGPSMSQALADSLRGAGMVGAVSNCFQLAPWAAFMVAQDRQWWQKHPETREFKGRRFSANRMIPGVERVDRSFTNWNSGVLALQASMLLGATRILLYGFDMHGSHFFGTYTNGLGNTTDLRRKVHLKQYADWARKNHAVTVINCTPGSALRCFPFEQQAMAA
jgi:hypothetical protein